MRITGIALSLAITFSSSAAFAGELCSADELGKLRDGSKIAAAEAVGTLTQGAKGERPAGQAVQAPALGDEAAISSDDKAEIDAILAADKTATSISDKAQQ